MRTLRSLSLVLGGLVVSLALAACGAAPTPTATRAPANTPIAATAVATIVAAAPATAITIPTPTRPALSPTAVPAKPAEVSKPVATVAAQPTAAATVQAGSPAATGASATPKVDTFAKGLTAPWAIAFAPDGRIFITERPGRIRIIENGQLLADPWMTVEVTEMGESGLLGIALDPGFAQNRFAYIAYTYKGADGKPLNRLARVREDTATKKGVPDKVLMDAVLAAGNHDGGRVKIGPDGKLYWGMGEAGQRTLSQDPVGPSGKILRLNLDGTIPADNPTPGSAVYAIGLRNPQGLAWQPGTNRLYATDHGPSGENGCCRDELNFIEPGKNYGWPLITGDQKRDGLISPVLQSGDGVWAPSGMTFVTKGPWAGSILFTALRGTGLMKVQIDSAIPTKVNANEMLFTNQFGRLRDVAEGPDGTLYVLTSNKDGRGRPGPDDDRVLRLVFP